MAHVLEYRRDPYRDRDAWFVDGKSLEFRAFPSEHDLNLETTAPLADIRAEWVRRIMIGVEFETGWRPGYSDIWPILFPHIPLTTNVGQYWPQTP